MSPFPDKTVKLWKISERDKRPEGYNLKDEDGRIRNPLTITSLRVRGHAALTPQNMSHGATATILLAWGQKASYDLKTTFQMKTKTKHFNLQARRLLLQTEVAHESTVIMC